MIRVTRLFLGLGLATIVLLGGSSMAHAQYQAPPPGYYAPPPSYGGGYPPPPPPRYRYRLYREGLVIGGAIGVGGISAQDCGDTCGVAGAGEFHIGGMLNPRTALVGDFWVNVRDVPNSDATVRHFLYTIALQYWPIDILWLKAGIGGGNMNVSSNVDGYTYGDENGLGILLAGGIEFLHASTFALDGQLRYGHGFYSEGGDVNVWALMIGISWY